MSAFQLLVFSPWVVTAAGRIHWVCADAIYLCSWFMERDEVERRRETKEKKWLLKVSLAGPTSYLRLET